MFRALLVLAVVGFASEALASPPCAPIVCDPKKPGGPSLCAYKADWILEGEIHSVGEEYGPVCETMLGCSIIWRGGHVSMLKGTVALTKLNAETALSGVFKPDAYGGQIRIEAGSHCWPTAQVDPSLVGRRARFYGINSTNVLRFQSFVRAGYFAFELID